MRGAVFDQPDDYPPARRRLRASRFKPPRIASRTSSRTAPQRAGGIVAVRTAHRRARRCMGVRRGTGLAGHTPTNRDLAAAATGRDRKLAGRFGVPREYFLRLREPRKNTDASPAVGGAVGSQSGQATWIVCPPTPLYGVGAGRVSSLTLSRQCFSGEGAGAGGSLAGYGRHSEGGGAGWWMILGRSARR